MIRELRKLLRHVKSKERKVLLVRDLGHNRTHGVQLSNLFDHISSNSLYNRSCRHFRSLLSIVSYWGICKPVCFIPRSLLLPTITSDPRVKPTYLFLHTITYSYILPLVYYSLKSCFPTILWKTYPCTCFLFPILCEFQDPWWGVEVGNCMLFYKWRKSSVRWRVKVNCDLGKPSLLWMSRPIFLTAWASV